MLILVATLSGCSQVSYYLQATSGQIELIRKRQPVTDLITNPATTPELKRKLELATRIRAFASSDLGLPDNKTFQTYTDIERPYVTWNVVATPRYSTGRKRPGAFRWLAASPIKVISPRLVHRN